MDLIPIHDLEKRSPLFRGKVGRFLARRLKRLTGIDRIEERCARHAHLSGADFTRAFLKDLNLRYEVQGLEHLEELGPGPFLTVSHHPYGGLDGVILIDLFGRYRSDYRMMANKFLSNVEMLQGSFISVVPSTRNSNGVARESLQGLREAIRHISQGHPLGLFPSGAVSDYHLLKGRVCDREWQPSAVRLIRKLEVPVVPVYFTGRNSAFFYLLGFVNWRIRTLRLPGEILNKENRSVSLRIGKVIGVDEQRRCPEDRYGAMLRDSVYNL